jgi:hypothetical protein
MAFNKRAGEALGLPAQGLSERAHHAAVAHREEGELDAVVEHLDQGLGGHLHVAEDQDGVELEAGDLQRDVPEEVKKIRPSPAGAA